MKRDFLTNSRSNQPDLPENISPGYDGIALQPPINFFSRQKAREASISIDSICPEMEGGSRAGDRANWSQFTQRASIGNLGRARSIFSRKMIPWIEANTCLLSGDTLISEWDPFWLRRTGRFILSLSHQCKVERESIVRKDHMKGTDFEGSAS